MTVTVCAPGGTGLPRQVCFPGSPLTDSSDRIDISSMMLYHVLFHCVPDTAKHVSYMIALNPHLSLL